MSTPATEKLGHIIDSSVVGLEEGVKEGFMEGVVGEMEGFKGGNWVGLKDGVRLGPEGEVVGDCEGTGTPVHIGHHVIH